MELNITDIEESAYQNFKDGIRNKLTFKNYHSDLKRFLDLIPDKIYTDNNQMPPAEKTIEIQSESFVTLTRNDTKISKSIIKAYVRTLKQRIDEKELSIARAENLLKPIKALFSSNDIDFSWSKINKSFPKKGKSQDKAYSREQLQMMLAKSTDLVDKIMITLCSSAGFRVEAWDFFTWNDIVFFYGDDGKIKGGAVCIYRGDDEQYWTHFTPEAGKYLLLYKEYWKSRFNSYPESTDPLIVSIRIRKIPKGIGKKGMEARMRKLAKDCGLRPPLLPGQKRHKVMLDHGLRKYFNTMCRRAKIDFADKEELQGREASKNESHYERYEESDFERWDEYQKAIPFLTIDDSERSLVELTRLKEEKDVLKLKLNENSELKEMLQQERSARIKHENETKKAFAKLREEQTREWN